MPTTRRCTCRCQRSSATRDGNRMRRRQNHAPPHKNSNHGASTLQEAQSRLETIRSSSDAAAELDTALVQLASLEEEMESAKQLPDMGFEAYNPG